ncbi:hypothetical protein [Actinomycetospora soli]|uniref:hypothetical protein n=1 Tax=Actinomycetospora soli TaxID=2893887 RepID=UPI001E4D86BF|nr:hypothetical protein [Actinomycetospora soli]MCD2190904.1 hypothetical protein [Actinomycetospora soli]
MTDSTEPRVGTEDRATQEGDAPPSRRRVVGVLADPDRPIEIAEAIADGLLPRLLAEEIDDGVVWEVHTCTRPLAVGEEDMSEMLDAAARLLADETWDWAVYITDLPIRSDGRPVLADVCVDRGVATLSLPGLGMLALQRRTAAVVVRLVAALCGAAERTRVDRGVLHRHRATRRIAAVTSPIRSTSVGDGDGRERLHTPPVRGRIRLLAGMIHTNHPGRLLLGMSSAFGATVAASAFMIFNSST